MRQKFLIYIICLSEITFLESKDKPFSKVCIEKILTHFDENIPIDQMVLSWGYYFPSYVIFQIACRCIELGLDYMLIYKRSNYIIDFYWIWEVGLFNELQFEILIEIGRYLIRIDEGEFLFEIAKVLLDQGHIDKSEIILLEIFEFFKIGDNFLEKNRNFIAVANEFTKQNKHEKAVEILNYSYEIAKKNSDGWERQSALIEISKSFKNKRIFDTAKLLLEEALVEIQNFGDIEIKCKALIEISSEFAKQNSLDKAYLLLEEAINLTKNISDKEKRNKALIIILNEFTIHGKLEKALLLFDEVNKSINEITDNDEIRDFDQIGQENILYIDSREKFRPL
jgi:tetratricopeptide (TPR) repeat protein